MADDTFFVNDGLYIGTEIHQFFGGNEKTNKNGKTKNGNYR